MNSTYRWRLALFVAAALAAAVLTSGCDLPASTKSMNTADGSGSGTSECAKPTVRVVADWRRAEDNEIRSYGWEFPPAAKVFVLPHVELHFKNISTEKIWIREAWIRSEWTTSEGFKDSSFFPKLAGAYASVIPKPPSSNSSNEAESVEAGDTIEFSRDWETAGFLPDAEFADTNGIKPRTFVKPNFSWWFDSPERRSLCAERTSSAAAPKP